MKDKIPSEEDKALVDTLMYRDSKIVFVKAISSWSEQDEAWYVTEDVNTGTSYLSKFSQLNPVPTYKVYTENRRLRQLEKAREDVYRLEKVEEVK